ncbi:condensation domain-containing protein [Actinoplanes sp. TRM 88003]|uniref:Condensation domain-containing protein n=1 Tax=Paractinoplanes aksuensis TaxID=2939490 RepID=A0ABT1E3X3_9ACTN|nr:condensation domain-containing protein [Actinoplanes aksuensis]MCO8277808.1 condensation domain-containing protein [Actinoplanes aksuensis]
MQNVFIQDYCPPAGRLIEFRPTAAGVTAQVSADPLTYVQENHLRRILANKRAGRPQSPWLAVAFDLPGALDVPAMTAALEIWVARHSSLLSWFSSDDDGRLNRHVTGPVTMTDVAVEAGEDVRGYLKRRFDEGTDPFQWPPFVSGAILGESTTTFYYAVDHTHTDATSMLLLFHELRMIYQSSAIGVELALPEVGSYAETAARERKRVADLTRDSPEAREWLDIWRSGPPPSFALDIGVRPGQMYTSAILHREMLEPDLSERFTQVCREQGAGFTAGWLTALAITDYEMTGRSRYTALTIVSTRGEPRWQSAQGWFINLLPISFTVDEQNFEGLLKTAQSGFDRGRKLSGVPMWKIMELLPQLDPQRGSAAAIAPVVSYLDFRHAPHAEEWTSLNFTGLAAPSPTSEVSMWLSRFPESTDIHVQYPDTGSAQAPLELYVNHLREVLREIASAGSYSLKQPVTPTQVSAE